MVVSFKSSESLKNGSTFIENPQSLFSSNFVSRGARQLVGFNFKEPENLLSIVVVADLSSGYLGKGENSSSESLASST